MSTDYKLNFEIVWITLFTFKRNGYLDQYKDRYETQFAITN